MKPEDSTRQPLNSLHKPTENILLRVTLPKRTGRKRKSGSNEPFQHHDEKPEEVARHDHEIKASQMGRDRVPDVLQKLRDNVGKYRVQAVGTIKDTHRFREIPDFVWSNRGSSFMQQMQDKVLPLEYERLKHFEFYPHSEENTTNVELIPPPTFSHVSIPFNYA